VIVLRSHQGNQGIVQRHEIILQAAEVSQTRRGSSTSSKLRYWCA